MVECGVVVNDNGNNNGSLNWTRSYEKHADHVCGRAHTEEVFLLKTLILDRQMSFGGGAGRACDQFQPAG